MKRVAMALVVACGCTSDATGVAVDAPPGAEADGAPGAPDGRPAPDAKPAPDAPPVVGNATLSPYIVVDQFGYRPSAEKIAVIRDPQTGFDGAQSFTPGATYALVDARSGAKLKSGAPAAWNGGATDATSGDKAWWFDFSSVTTPGEYYVLDEARNVRSDVFRIADDVYRDVLAQAVRMFFYQRAGFAKSAQHAGAGWADGASHLGALQDSHCRRFDAAGDASTEKDLRGGWYDAGDYNKYTNWTAGYVVQLLRAYRERPSAFRDDYGIPESGNGRPDLLDEVKYGLDWVVRMQNADGSVLSIVGLSHASPPSSASGQSLYGPANTSATLSAAAAFAYGAIVFRPFDGAYADDLTARAKKAWSWADAHPAVIFRNNEGAASGLGAGQQEVDDEGRFAKKLAAAVYLFALTGEATYKSYVDANYAQIHLMAWSFAYPFEVEQQDTLLEYARLPGATAAVASAIRATYAGAIVSDDNLGGIRTNRDPYGAYLKDYVWGSNSTKSAQGNMLADVPAYGVGAALEADAMRGAERYVHYVHGVNPLGLVYLSNMGAFGAAKSVTRFYHTWFAHGSARWDAVGESTYGPPPGYLVGGPNPTYSWDGCCPSGCSGASCGGAVLSPPANQPAQKAYRDFNDGWPINSWEVTEPSDGYQAAYVRLLSKFVL